MTNSARHMSKKILGIICVTHLIFCTPVQAWWLFGKNEKTAQKAETKSDDFSFEFQASGSYSTLPTLMLCRGEDQQFLKFGKVVFDDLEFTDQFSFVDDAEKTSVCFSKTAQELHEFKCQKLFEQGTSLLMYFKHVGGVTYKNGIEEKFVQVTIKDTNSDTELFSQKATFNTNNCIFKGHELASNILKALTGEPGVCQSTLAYCKTLGAWHKVICVSDYACKKGSVVVTTKGVNVAPCWHTKVPVLFYSQLTKSNNRLMSVDLKTKNHSIVCSYNGLNMQPSFSGDGKRAVICLSNGKGNSELYWYDQNVCSHLGKRVFKPLTNNGAHNVSPCMLPDENLVFCSNFQTGQPQVYYMNTKEHKVRRLTDGTGYCAAPSYCAKTNSLVYVRQVGNTFQLFTLSLDNLDRIRERQITFSVGDKQEPSWSECGRYIAFSSDHTDKKNPAVPQIAVLNFKSGKVRVLTSGTEPKSFPRWSGMPINL